MSRPNYVYVIRYGDRDHKIGHSIDPADRRRALGPEAERVVRTWHRPDGDAPCVENLAHRLLAGQRLPIAGQRERFWVSEASAVAAVELAASLVDDERGYMPERPDAPAVPVVAAPPDPARAAYTFTDAVAAAGGEEVVLAELEAMAKAVTPPDQWERTLRWLMDGVR